MEWRWGTAACWANGIVKTEGEDGGIKDERCIMSVPEGGSGWGEERRRGRVTGVERITCREGGTTEEFEM